jgi:hypothetical protein
MLKKLVLSLICIALLTVQANSQSAQLETDQQKKADAKREKSFNVNETVYKKAADYVIGYYVKAYIDKKTDEKWRELNFKEEWKKLESNSFQQPVSEQDLENCIKKLPSSFKVSGINENIRQKTNDLYKELIVKRDEFQLSEKQKIVEQLIKLPEKYYPNWKNNSTGKPRFQEQYDALKRELEEKLPDDAVKYQEQKADIPSTQALLVQENSSKPDNQKATSFLWLYILLFVVAIIVCIAIWKREWLNENLMNRFKKDDSLSDDEESEEETESTSDESKIKLQPKDLEKVFLWILNDNKNLTKFSQVVLNDEELCYQWVKNVMKYPKILELLKNEMPPETSTQAKKLEEQQMERSKFVQTQGSSFSIAYCDSIINGYFNRLSDSPDDDTIFEMYMQNTSYAKFTLHAAAYRRIIANPSFIDGCDKQVLPDAQNVKVRRGDEGIAQRQTDGRWKIIKKLNVIIE